MKRCRKCGELKPLEEFYKARGMADGRRSDCRTCNLVAKKQRYEANPALAVARVKRWQQANREKYRSAQRAYRATRRDALREATSDARSGSRKPTTTTS
jgi:hypothetical protein